MKSHLREAHPEVWTRQLATCKGVSRTCPYCAHTQTGKRLTDHIRLEHPDMYARWLAACQQGADRERLLRP